MAAQDMTSANPRRRRGGSLPAAILSVLFAVVLIPAGVSQLIDGPGPGAQQTAGGIALLGAGAGLCLIAMATFSIRSETGGLAYARRLVWIGRGATLGGAVLGTAVGIIGDAVTDAPDVSWISAALTAGICIIVTLMLALTTMIGLYRAET